MAERLFSDFFIADEPAEGAAGPLTGEVAAAMADVVGGRSVVLTLNANLPSADRSAVRTFLEQMVRVAGTLDGRRQEEAIARLATIIMPDPLAEARGILAVDNLLLRDRFVSEVPTLSGAEVGAQSGLGGGNPYAAAARWKKNGDIFSVHHRGAEHFPAFQFQDGRPRPVVKSILKALPDPFSPWQRAFWFVAANGWLDHSTPMSRLDAADLVVGAATREAEDVVG